MVENTNLSNVKNNFTLLNLLMNRDFFFLWLASGFWWLAMWVEMIIVGWLTLEITNSALSVSIAGFCRAIPLLLVGPIGPLMIQRYEKRKILWGLQGTGALITLILVLIHLKFHIDYYIILFYCLVMGILWALDWPTRRSILPDIVGTSRVTDGLLMENILQSLTRIIGPIGGGFVLATIGIEGSLITLFVISFTSLLCLLFIGDIPNDSFNRINFSGFADEFCKGINFVRKTSAVLGVFFITLVMNIWAFPFQILLPVIARDVLNQGPIGLGVLAAANGIGVTIGLVIINQTKKKYSDRLLFFSGSLIVCFGLFLFSFTCNIWFAFLYLFLAGIGQAGFSVMQSSIILTSIPNRMRSRAMGAIVFAIGLGPLGRLQAGATAEMFDIQIAVGSMALMAAIGVISTKLFLVDFLDRQH